MNRSCCKVKGVDLAWKGGLWHVPDKLHAYEGVEPKISPAPHIHIEPTWLTGVLQRRGSQSSAMIYYTVKVNLCRVLVPNSMKGGSTSQPLIFYMVRVN